MVELSESMLDEKISQEFILKYIDKTRNYLIKEIKQKISMSKKHKKVCMILNCNQLQLFSALTDLVSVSAFVSLVGIPIGIASSAVGLKICVITVGIRKYK